LRLRPQARKAVGSSDVKRRLACDARKQWGELGGGMSRTLKGLLRELNIEVIPNSRNHSRCARQTWRPTDQPAARMAA
jgi:hypothetical protein